MGAKLRYIETNDVQSWASFVLRPVPDPWRACEYFTIGVGTDDQAGTELFQIWVATPSMKHRLVDQNGEFKGVLVDCFEAEGIRHALENYIGAIEGDSWEQIAEQLYRLT